MSTTSNSAAASLAPVTVKIFSWEPFLLNPHIDPDGEDLMEHLTKKYGPSASKNFGDPNSHLMKAGRAVGINFKMDRNVYPTVQAHAVMEYVKNDLGDGINKSNLIMEELYKRYFEQGENINSVAVLQEVCSKFIDVPQEEVERVALDSGRHEKIIKKDQVHKTKMQIRGVPFYIIEQQDGSQPAGFSGAQPPEMIAEYLREAAGMEEEE